MHRHRSIRVIRGRTLSLDAGKRRWFGMARTQRFHVLGSLRERDELHRRVGILGAGGYDQNVGFDRAVRAAGRPARLAPERGTRRSRSSPGPSS